MPGWGGVAMGITALVAAVVASPAENVARMVWRVAG